MDAAALVISHRKIKPAQIFWIPGWVPGASSSPQLTLCSEVTMSERGSAAAKGYSHLSMRSNY